MLSKPLIIALIVSISFNLLFGYLSYRFYADKVGVESKLELCLSANKSLEQSVEKEKKACQIQDDVVSSYTKEKQEIVKETYGVLDTIDRLPSTPTQTDSNPKRQENVNKQIEDAPVSLDAKLGDDIKRVLSQSCHSAKGNNCDNP